MLEIFGVFTYTLKFISTIISATLKMSLYDER